MSPAAEWCGQCYALRAPVAPGGPFSASVPAGPSQFTGTVTTVSAPATAVGAAPAGSIMSGTRASEKQAYVPLVAKTRWGKTPTTFGPLGRVLCTIFLVVPLIPLAIVAVFTGGFEAGGAVVWGLFIMPLGLRDVWKVGTIPLN